jgi:hypothetical protein
VKTISSLLNCNIAMEKKNNVKGVVSIGDVNARI